LHLIGRTIMFDLPHCDETEQPVLAHDRARLPHAALAAHLAADLDGQVQPHGCLAPQVKKFGASATMIQGTLAALSMTMAQQRDDLAEAQNALTSSLATIERVSAQLCGMAEQADAIAQRIGSLDEQARQLDDTVPLFGQIAEQLGQLAADAADATRGDGRPESLAVIAQQAQRLAARAGAATGDLAARAGAIRDDSRALQASIAAAPRQAVEFTAVGNEATRSVREMLSQGRRMSETIAGGAMYGLIETAKLDHLVHKFEIYKVFLGISHQHADDFASHASCPLGQWYYRGDGRRHFAGLPGYRELEPAHIAFHSHGVQAMRWFQAGDVAAGIDEAIEMEHASFRILAELERLAAAGDRALAGRHLAPS
jgi:hypothetical protein